MLLAWKNRATGASLAAFTAISVLFAQALLPAAALAAESVGGSRVELCTSAGPKVVILGSDGQGGLPSFVSQSISPAHAHSL